MSELSYEQFVSMLERSKLLEPERILRLIEQFNSSEAAATRPDNAQPFADYLVGDGALTLWQCQKLLAGRYRGFFLGKYKLLDHLGSGGMSSVYLAEHTFMHRRVAIKVLTIKVLTVPRTTQNPYVARLRFEAQAGAVLDHPNIVRVYDFDHDGRNDYLVMEYIEGRDLNTLVEHEGPLNFHVAADYIAQAATGLDHAHAAGLIHRDIKPANLLVDPKGTVKILDMGLAKFVSMADVSAQFGQEDHVLGTADYLGPEQAVNSQTVDQRVDIYSLGCTLYFLLTGHPPFAAGTVLERLAAHRQQIAPSILLDRPDAPAPLVDICRRMMEKSPENRYQSAKEVWDALTGWLRAESEAGRVATPMPKRIPPGSLPPRKPSPSRISLVTGSSSDLASAAGESENAAPLELADQMGQPQAPSPAAALPPPVRPSVAPPLATHREPPFDPPRRRRRFAAKSRVQWLRTLLVVGLLLGAALVVLGMLSR